MGACWNSIECVQKIYQLLRYGGAILSLFGILAVIGSIFVGNRAEILRAPRGVTPEQRARLVKRLRSATGTLYDVGALISDPESGQYAQQLIGILQAAGWRGNVIPSLFQTTGQPLGILIGTFRRDEISPSAGLLLEALLSEGVPDVYFTNDFSTTENVVAIRIASRRAMVGEVRGRRMRRVTDEEAERWEALAREHGFVNERGDLIPGRFRIEKVMPGQLHITLLTPAPAERHTEDLQRKAPPILFDRMPSGEIVLPGRWSQYVLESLHTDPTLPPEIRAGAAVLSRRGQFPNVILPPDVETVMFLIPDSTGKEIPYEALPPLTQIILEWTVTVEQGEE